MGRRDDIDLAFRKAVKVEPSGRRTITTSGFVRELAKYNWEWSLRQANEWIETYVTTFTDISTQEGENRTFKLYNPNGGL
jgi:hypothetical protein